MLALDVIEHLDLDALAVMRLGTRVRPGGALIVTVPALPAPLASLTRYKVIAAVISPKTFSVFDGSGLSFMHFLVGPVAPPDCPKPARIAQSAPWRLTFRSVSPPLEKRPTILGLASRPGGQLEERRALRGRLKIGTSLVATARRPPTQP